MFYCDSCRVPRKWPVTVLQSVGKCEICGRSGFCNNVPSKDLPMPETPA